MRQQDLPAQSLIYFLYSGVYLKICDFYQKFSEKKNFAAPGLEALTVRLIVHKVN